MFTGLTHTRYSHASAAPMFALTCVMIVAAGRDMAQGSVRALRAGSLVDLGTMQTKFKALAGAEVVPQRTAREEQ